MTKFEIHWDVKARLVSLYLILRIVWAKKRWAWANPNADEQRNAVREQIQESMSKKHWSWSNPRVDERKTLFMIKSKKRWAKNAVHDQIQEPMSKKRCLWSNPNADEQKIASGSKYN